MLESTSNEEPTEFLAGDEDYLPLKALETVELEPDWNEAAEHPQIDIDPSFFLIIKRR